jgi:hypothetical protein
MGPSRPSESQMLSELLELLKDRPIVEETPKSDNAIKSLAAAFSALVVLIGAVLFFGALFNRVSAVEINQTNFVTKDAYKGLIDNITDLKERQIRMEEKLDYIQTEQKKNK